jgi:deazaflavin-dependent oxidoreductase (nitroreductase family)
MTEREELNRPVIEEFRAAGGVVGGQFAGTRMLLLTCRGARTGRERTLPLAYLPDGENLVVFAANGGRDTDPAWMVNLRATPEAVVEVGTRTIEVSADIVEGSECERLLQAGLSEMPWFAGVQARTARPIPVVVLSPR